MCMIPRFGKLNSFYDLFYKQKINLTQKLPQFTQKRISIVTKHIILNFLDNLADYIFTNGKIYTMNAQQSQFQAVAIKRGKILFTGTMIEALIYKGMDTEIVDLNGRTMLPGFIDPHIHMCSTMFGHWLDLSPFVNVNMEQIKQKLLKKIEEVKNKPTEWITAQLFDPTVTRGHLDVSRQNLDKLCPNNPIFILQANGHIAHVNSAALKIADITQKIKDPPHGRFIRNQNGILTGQLQETAVMVIKQYLQISGKDYVKNFKQFLKYCSSKGCTSLHDCGIGLIDPKLDLSILYEAMQDDPPVRYSGMLISSCWDTWMQLKIVPQFKDELLRINGMKFSADGSTQGGSAFLRQQYIKPQWSKGKANYKLQSLAESIQLAHDKGWQVGVHANGDAAIDLVLNAIQIVQKKNPRSDLRHRIQHSTICHKQQLKRMKELNVSPSFLIGHIYYYGENFQKDILGQQRANLLDPIKSAIQYGVRPTIHSDYNCQPVDPIRCIYNAVTRKTKQGNIVINPAECVTPYEAIKAMTIDAAWQCHMDDIVGSIQPGKKADFVILNKNPLMIPQSEIINIKVVQTWMNGVCRFKSQLKTHGQFNLQKSNHSVVSQESV